jgi:hypothetical protein
MGTSSVNGPFFIAMLNNRRVKLLEPIRLVPKFIRITIEGGQPLTKYLRKHCQILYDESRALVPGLLVEFQTTYPLGIVVAAGFPLSLVFC